MKSRIAAFPPSVLAVLAWAFAPTPAAAASVTYDTLNSQLCVGAIGCGTASQQLGGATGLTVTYVPIASGTTVDADPTTFTGFGAIQVACVGGGTACGTQDLSNLRLYLNISQTGPSAGTSQLLEGTFEGVCCGFGPNVSGNSSTAVLRWLAGSSTTIGLVTYSAGLFGGTSVGINPPSTGNGLSPQISGSISAVPVPAAAWLMLSGLAGLGALRRERTAAGTAAGV